MANGWARPRRSLSIRLLGLFAILLVITHLIHLRQETGLWPILLGVVFPIAFAGLLGLATLKLDRSELAAEGVFIVAIYTLAGSIAASIVEIVGIVYRHIEMGDMNFVADLGHEGHILFTCATIGALGGWLIGWNAAHRHRKNRVLARKNEELQERTDRLQEVTSILSHDLRNPLNVAIGRLQVVREKCDNEHLRAIQRSLDRIESIISETLVLARQDRTIGEQTTVDVAKVARDAWSTVETADLELEIESSDSVEADPNRLREAFENLFRNAVDHGGDDLETVRVGLEDGVLYVEDDGVGIPANMQSDIFETGMTTEPTGTGLGLSIVERIVSAHGWEITSMDGHTGGARFEIAVGGRSGI